MRLLDRYEEVVAESSARQLASGLEGRRSCVTPRGQAGRRRNSRLDDSDDGRPASTHWEAISGPPEFYRVTNVSQRPAGHAGDSPRDRPCTST